MNQSEQILIVFYKDSHWLCAIVAALIFWLGYGYLVAPLQYFNVFSSLDFFLSMILIYPILEEIVFRGWLQSMLLKKKSMIFTWFGISLANVTTSIIFVLLHLINQSIVWALLVFIPSLVFGYFKDRYNLLLPSILLHIFYNAGFFYFIGP